MRNFNHFVDWLNTNTELSKYTIGRYSQAINIIFTELESYGLPKVDLYTSNLSFIDDILRNNSFKIKNQKGNHMYSAALRHLINYIEFYNDQEFQEELNRLHLIGQLLKYPDFKLAI